MAGFSGTQVYYTVFDEDSGDFVVVGCETSGTVTRSNPLIDVTCKHSGNWREIADDNGTRTQDDTIELLAFNDVGIEIIKNAVGGRSLLTFQQLNSVDGSTKQFGSYVTSVTQTNPNGAVATFSITLNSSSAFSNADTLFDNTVHYFDGNVVRVVRLTDGEEVSFYNAPIKPSYTDFKISSIDSTGLVYAIGVDSNAGTEELVRFRPNLTPERIDPLPNAQSVVVDASGDIIYTTGGANILKRDGDTMLQTESFVASGNATDVSVSSNGDTVVNTLNNGIYVHDGFTSTVILHKPAVASSVFDMASGNLFVKADGSPAGLKVYDSTFEQLLYGPFELAIPNPSSIACSGRLE